MRARLLWVLVGLTAAAAVSPALAQRNDAGKTPLPSAIAGLPAAPPLENRPPSSSGLDLPKDDLAAFEYLRGYTARRGGDDPLALESRIVAKAFVALAHYYLAGIPNSTVEPDPARARNLLMYAATYFRDADAQYYLGRLFLEGIDAPPDPMAAARWLSLAADKDHHRAQALLGRMLFTGEGLPRQAALGLMFLMLASESPTAEEAWIGDLFAAAFKQASVEEQAQALVLLERRLKRNGDARRAP
jgi:uncharacterized protein